MFILHLVHLLVCASLKASGNIARSLLSLLRGAPPMLLANTELKEQLRELRSRSRRLEQRIDFLKVVLKAEEDRSEQQREAHQAAMVRVMDHARSVHDALQRSHEAEMAEVTEYFCSVRDDLQRSNDALQAAIVVLSRNGSKTEDAGDGCQNADPMPRRGATSPEGLSIDDEVGAPLLDQHSSRLGHIAAPLRSKDPQGRRWWTTRSFGAATGRLTLRPASNSRTMFRSADSQPGDRPAART